MQKLDYWLVYQTSNSKWRVFADPSGTLILFPNQEMAMDVGRKLISTQLATTFAVLDVRMSHHVTGPLNQMAFPESETWGEHNG